MELKTLNDLVNWTCECNCVTFDGEVCMSCGKSSSKSGDIVFDDLKQLAINWIKEEIKIWDSRHPLSTKGKTSDVPVIMRWMDRFNINEEDLKDGKRKS